MIDELAVEMSNLWFFRLKRAEQQRRRSSGEQSVGSASNQSVADLSASCLTGTRYQLSTGESIEQARDRDKLKMRASGAQVPTVNIIRSDSVLSCASRIQSDLELDLAGKRQVLVSQRERERLAKSELLTEASGGPEESEAAKRAFRVSRKRRVLEREQRLREQAASDIERRASNTSSEFNQRDQLESGKVPPIRERSLLNPAGRNLADSMDNLASLIPR